MSNSEALVSEPELVSSPDDPDGGGETPDAPESTADAAEVARTERLGAWVEAGATSLPALLIALGSAAAGGLALAIRRHRRS